MMSVVAMRGRVMVGLAAIVVYGVLAWSGCSHTKPYYRHDVPMSHRDGLV